MWQPAQKSFCHKAIPKLVEIFLEQKFQKFNENTIVSKTEYRKLLKEIKKTGIAYDKGERYLNTHAMATPIYNFEGQTKAAVVIAGPAYRLTDSFLESAIPALQETAEKISKLLFH